MRVWHTKKVVAYDACINPQFGTDTIQERGFPKLEYFCLPARSKMGNSHLVMGTVLLTGR
jgi:hypothetical protein